MALTNRSAITLPDLWSRLMDPIDLTRSAIKVEEFREDGALVVRAELPGIDPDRDVELTIADGVLRLHAERREEHTDDGTDGYRSEFRYGSFDRTLRLPAGTTKEEVAATYRDGILEVHIPMNGDAVEEKRVPIAKG
jgi:HSP20 family protein